MVMIHALLGAISEFICGQKSIKRNDSLEELDMDTSWPETEWDLHYYEASVYLHEGKNNDRFTINPRDPTRHFAYKVVHSTWFHLLNLFAPICLLLLTIFEPPSLNFIHIPFWAHGIIEISMLLVISIELVMRLKWLGIKHFISHTRTILKVVLFLVMFAEAVVLMVRQTSHFRVTRSLRPLFLLDSFYCRNIRRFIRQLLQSLAAIFNVFLLLISFMLIFAILGFFLFSNNPADTYFQSISDSFISLFILMTTANFPDVMLPSFKKSKWSAIFFIIYISLELFIFMNMFLAVVYGAFLRAEKDKFKKLYLHKRNGCMLAYRLLSNECPDGISFKHFRGCMHYYKPRMDSKEVYLVFKSLDINDSGRLSLNEFMGIFDNIKLSWEKEKVIDMENMTFSMRAKSCLFKVASNKWFNNCLNVVILLNFIWVLFDSIRLSVMKYQSAQSSFDWTLEEAKFYWITVLFVLIYVMEALLKMSGFGFSKYFSNGWNIFDFLVTVASLAGVVVQLASSNMFCIMVVRPLRVLRLFKIKSGLRHVFDSLFMLISRICSLAVVMLLLLYFFAIIGMEMFAPYSENLKNCCLNTSVQQYYVYNNGSGLDGYYYLCTFENILDSGVTLFELIVVNNWWIIMEGFAYVVSPWTRIYFMLFYLVTMVVMAVVVAFILEAYLFREQCREDYNGHKYHRVVVSISPQEVTELESGGDPSSALQKEMEPTPDVTFYEGTRRLEKDDFSLRMYSSEVQSWVAESLL